MLTPTSEDEFFQDGKASKMYTTDIVMSIGECGYKCVRTTFMVFNFIFAVVGVAILLLGIWLHVEREEATGYYAHASKNINFVNGPNFLLAVGTITLLVSLLACCGAKAGNYCMLGSYTAIMATILALQITSIFITYVYRERIENSLRVDFQKTLRDYGQHGFRELSKSIDDLQKDFHCCGNEDYTDWFRTGWTRNGTDMVPMSCCRLPSTPECNKNLTNSSDGIYLVGCYGYIKKYFLENLHIISGFGLWVVLTETLGILFSIIMIVKVRQERNAKVATDDFP